MCHLTQETPSLAKHTEGTNQGRLPPVLFVIRKSKSSGTFYIALIICIHLKSSFHQRSKRQKIFTSLLKVATGDHDFPLLGRL